MKSIKNRTTVITGAATAMLGLALIGLASCSSGDDPTATLTPGGSAALQGPLVFVNNYGRQERLTSVALKGDSGNAVVNTIAEISHRRLRATWHLGTCSFQKVNGSL